MWTAIEDPLSFRRLVQVLSEHDPHAAALGQMFPGLARFRCPACDRCYCDADWRGIPIFEDGFYEHMVGTCPRGHEAIVDD